MLVPWGDGISFPREGSEVCPDAEECFAGGLGEEGLSQLSFRVGRVLERALSRGSAEGREVSHTDAGLSVLWTGL